MFLTGKKFSCTIEDLQNQIDKADYCTITANTVKTLLHGAVSDSKTLEIELYTYTTKHNHV